MWKECKITAKIDGEGKVKGKERAGDTDFCCVLLSVVSVSRSRGNGLRKNTLSRRHQAGAWRTFGISKVQFIKYWNFDRSSA